MKLREIWDGTLTEDEVRKLADKLMILKRILGDITCCAVIGIVIYFAWEILWGFRPGGPVDQLRSLQ